MSLRAHDDQVFEEDEAELRGRYSAEEKLAAVTRELGYRRRVYDRRVAAKQMRQVQADREIGIFESIEADYRKACRAGRLL
ncbi:MAG TPA: hypothetical protein VGR19_05930 [Allosphingosinicella sp.]|nr:hypothetical protein [Allosphingosinicella sp.]